MSDVDIKQMPVMTHTRRLMFIVNVNELSESRLQIILFYKHEYFVIHYTTAADILIRSKDVQT
jgi:hypothetical protein